jgi:hypothetical protein
MSMRSGIKRRVFELVREGALVRIKPLVLIDPVFRCVLAGVGVWRDVRGPFEDSLHGDRMAQFRQTLDNFVAGGELPVGEDPHDKDPDTVLARIDPVAEQVWDIRVTEPGSGLRCFGCFAGKDTFIALTWDYREDIASDDWDRECEQCKEEWAALFPDHPPFKGDSLDDYLSCNFRASSPRRG